MRNVSNSVLLVVIGRLRHELRNRARLQYVMVSFDSIIYVLIQLAQMRPFFNHLS